MNKNKENLLQKQLEDILEMIASGTCTESMEELHKIKADIYMKIKPSTKESILVFREDDIDFIKNGTNKTGDRYESLLFLNNLNKLNGLNLNRAYVEYNEEYRQPIPYCVVKYKDKYFAALREGKSGEMRLINKIGFLGGHVTYIKGKTNGMMIFNSLYRELKEEANIEFANVLSAELIGTLKLSSGVEKDHLGLVFIVEVNTDKIKTIEEGVLKGKWFTVEELKKETNFENWSKIIVDELLPRY